MGSYLLNAVVNGLAGKEFESQVVTSKKTGKTVRRTFGAEEFALLTVVAHNQPDPGYFGRSDTIAYGDIDRFLRLTHIKRSSFFNTRSFLVELGLLSYSPHERLPDIMGHNIEKNYNNVYRIRVETIRALYPADAHDFWRHEILHLDDRTLAKLQPEDRRALALSPNEPVQPVDLTVQLADSTVQPLDLAVHTVDTNNKYKKNQNSHNNNTNADPFVVAAYEKQIDDLIKHIARALDAEPSQIVRKTLKKFVAGKWLDTIKDVVDKFETKAESNWWYRRKTVEQRIGLLMNDIKDVPLMDEDKVHAEKVMKAERQRRFNEEMARSRAAERSEDRSLMQPGMFD